MFENDQNLHPVLAQQAELFLHLLRSMLNPDPARRLWGSALLAHPYWQQQMHEGAPNLFAPPVAAIGSPQATQVFDANTNFRSE
jgi:hypothetical protein